MGDYGEQNSKGAEENDRVRCIALFQAPPVLRLHDLAPELSRSVRDVKWTHRPERSVSRTFVKGGTVGGGRRWRVACSYAYA